MARVTILNYTCYMHHERRGEYANTRRIPRDSGRFPSFPEIRPSQLFIHMKMQNNARCSKSVLEPVSSVAFARIN